MWHLAGMATAKYPESGAVYKRVRLESGLSQEALARAAEVNRRHIIRIENGENRPFPKLRDRIASILNVDPSSLPAAGEDPFASSAKEGITPSPSGSKTKSDESSTRRST